MQTENLKLTPEMLLWKKLGITNCTMDFSCGGDSMNDYSFVFYTDNKNKGKNEPAVVEVKCEELRSYFENEVFNQVEFYVNSDGHYQGEFGQVEITFEEDDDEPEFTYNKSSKSEWSEHTTNVIEIKLTEKMVKFINDYVSNINGGDEDCVINFKSDFIMNEEDEETYQKLQSLIVDEVSEFTPEIGDEDELSDWYSFTTNDEDGEFDTLTIKGNNLLVSVNNSFTTTKDE